MGMVRYYCISVDVDSVNRGKGKVLVFYLLFFMFIIFFWFIVFFI